MTTTTQRLDVEHPYRFAGAILVVVALVLIAFDLGVLARCGGGEGVCFDVASHGTSDGALVLFFVLFMIGLLMLMYTTAQATQTTRSSPPTAPPPQREVTVVTPAPVVQREVTYVTSPPPQGPTTTVTVSPPQ